MLNRYTKASMAALWIDEAKFGQWVQSLLAVLHGRVLAGQIDEDTFQQINSAVGVDVERVQELDRQFSHDASALIDRSRISKKSQDR